jgi:hypothetical protein
MTGTKEADEAARYLALVLSVRHEAAVGGIGQVRVDGRQPVSSSEIQDLPPVDPRDGREVT